MDVRTKQPINSISYTKLIFTDGSLHQAEAAGAAGAAGAGWTGFWGTASLETTIGHLNLARHEVFDAEATAACYGQSHDAAHVTDRHDHWISGYERDHGSTIRNTNIT